jgi:DNA-binding protein HU-alpha
MNKEGLISAVVAEAKMTKQNASLAVDAIFDAITESLKKKDPVSLVGFGSFKVNERKARSGRNPRTGEEITIAATTVPTFSAGKSLKEAVN